MMIPHPFIESCEHCNPLAEIPFDWILDRITGSDSRVTEYILEEPAKCPHCGRDILEKTFRTGGTSRSLSVTCRRREGSRLRFLYGPADSNNLHPAVASSITPFVSCATNTSWTAIT